MSSLNRFVKRHNIKSKWESRNSLTITKGGWTTKVQSYLLHLKVDGKEMRIPVVILAPPRTLTAEDALVYLAQNHKRTLRLFLGERLYRQFKKAA